MRHLVPDHRADAAVVVGVIGVGIVERRLQDTRRERDVVPIRAVACIHRRWSEAAPFVRIIRLSDAPDVVADGKLPRGHVVLRVRIAGD